MRAKAGQATLCVEGARTRTLLHSCSVLGDKRTNLDVHTRALQGKAVVFFPCFADGAMDARTLHAAEPAEDTKWVSQVWIRQTNFEGTTGRPDSSSSEEEEEEDGDENTQ